LSAASTKQAAKRWVRVLARFGLACRGLVSLAMALLAAALEAMIASRSCVSTGGRLVAVGKALVYAGLAGPPSRWRCTSR
jgi:hypothetical protein